MRNKWIIKATAEDMRNNPKTAALSDALGIRLPTAQLLVNRGYDTPESASMFLAKTNEMLHDPFLMKDMEKAASKILEAVSEGKKIVIYGDYDVDGVTSVSTLYLYLKKLGGDVDFYIPCRLGEGYGVSVSALEKLRAEGAEMIITVDTGITAFEEANIAREMGITMIVTDHHECHGELPEAYAVVNPRRPDCEYPFKELAGVGVVYKLLCALQILSDRDSDKVECVRKISAEYCDLVAIGTIADVMPIKDENRLIVSHGLQIIKNSPRPGLTELFEASDGGYSSQKNRKITSGYIGFTVAPRLNAAGRIENASLAVRLFLATNRSDAEPIAKLLCEINRRRQTEENKIMDEAYAKIAESHDFTRDPVIVLDDESWHRGIIGIVSSRITEKYGCPSILISFEQTPGEDTASIEAQMGIGKGSGRSVKGMNLVDALTYCGDLLEKYGGHELAAGLSIKRENLGAFKEKINEYARECFAGGKLTPTIEADCELPEEDITMAQCDELLALEPYGISNPVPLFAVRDLTVADITSVGSGRHAKITVRSGSMTVTAMYFRKTLAELDIYPGDKVDILCNLDINEFQNMKSLQFIVKDMVLSDKQYARETEERETYAALWNVISKGDSAEMTIPDGCFPEREDFAAVYNTLKRELHLEHEIFSVRALLHLLQSNGASMGYVKLKFIIKVFEELNLLGVSEIDREKEVYRFSYVYVKNKTMLEKSNIYKRLKSACQPR